jgi:hypothetical protein
VIYRSIGGMELESNTIEPNALASPPPNDRSPLLPDRREADFFVCDLMDATPKGDMASMEHPIFSLSTKPDHRVRR